jgi:periplasmic copper chaperone A
MRTLVLAGLAAALLAASCAPVTTPPGATATPGALTVTAVWARPGIAAAPAGPNMGGVVMPGAAGNSAVYMTITNGTSAADRLVKAATDIATSTELHTASMVNGVMEMRPVEAIDLPANGTFLLQPGGYHVMLVGLKSDLKVGAVFDVTLTFDKAGVTTVRASVREPAG